MSDTMSVQDSDARRMALNLLARREHSFLELQRKLQQRGCENPVLEQLLADLQSENLQSDARYVEVYVRSRQGRGIGPVRIRKELQERGMADELIAEYLDEHDPCWHELAMKAWHKHFGNCPAKDNKERAKQVRFLVYRGFSFDVVKDIVDGSAS